MATTATRSKSGVRDERTEKWLDQHGIEYEYEPKFELEKIDRAASVRNQARISQRPLLDEFVTTFSTAMENGDPFPPLVVYEARKGVFVVIDGNHRVAAAETLGRTDFPAYVVTNPTERRVTLLTYEANTKHGIPTSPEERVLQGAFLVENGMTGAAAAKSLGVPRHQIDAEVKRRETLTRLDSALTSSARDRLSKASLQRLSSIRSDPVMIAAAKLITEASLKADDVAQLIVDLNATRSEKDAMARLDQVREQYSGIIAATEGGQFDVPKHVHRLAQVIGSVIAIPPEVFVGIALDPKYTNLLRERARLASERLAEISEHLS